MSTLVVLELLTTPTVVLATSLVQRRLGAAAGGRLVALPVTTAPFLVLLGFQSGVTPVAAAASGIVAGQLAVVAFCGAYALAAHRLGEGPSLILALGAAATGDLVAAVLRARLPVLASAVLVISAAFGTARLVRSPVPADAPMSHLPIVRSTPVWEIPLRMTVTTAIVATLLATSPILGPAIAGVLATLPVILSVIVPATHLRDGAPAAITLATSGLVTLPATTTGVAVVAASLKVWGVVPAVSCAVLALALVDNVASRSRRPSPTG